MSYLKKVFLINDIWHDSTTTTTMRTPTATGMSFDFNAA